MKFIPITLLAASIFLFSNCGDSKTTTMETQTSDTTLKELLDAKRNKFEETASDEKKKIYAEGIAAVENSGVIQHAKQVGDKAPDFKLTNATGKTVLLSDYLKKGPVILTWYRGGWCPYCNITLNKLQAQLPNIHALGANLLALTPELPDKSISTAEKNTLKFEVLSDSGNVVGNMYGIIYSLTPDVADSYQKGFDLHSFNGDESNELPLAATYVIDTDGTITYAFLDADYRNRAEPAVLIEELKKLK